MDIGKQFTLNKEVCKLCNEKTGYIWKKDDELYWKIGLMFCCYESCYIFTDNITTECRYKLE